MSVEKMMKRIGSFMAPRMNFAGSGVSEHPCCCKISNTPCNNCVDDTGPEQWRINVSGLPVNTSHGTTWDPNGTHYAHGTNCSWSGSNKPDLWCGNPPCTRYTNVSVTLSGLTLTVNLWSTGSDCGTPTYTWVKTFTTEHVVDGKLDCLAISGVPLTAQGDYPDVTIYSYPYEYHGYVWDICDCTGMTITDYPLGMTGAEGIAGPSALELILDGQSYALTRSGDPGLSCDPYPLPECYWYGLDPFYQYNWPQDCTDLDDCHILGPGFIVCASSARSGWVLEGRWGDCKNGVYCEDRIIFTVGNVCSGACGGLCRLDASGTVLTVGSHDPFPCTTEAYQLLGKPWSLHSP